MPTSRRAFVGAGLAGLAGTTALAGCSGDDAAPAPAESSGTTSAPASSTPSTAPSTPPADPFTESLTLPDFDPTDWESVRAQFPLSPDLAHFSAWALSPHTAPVTAAIDYHRRRLAADTQRGLGEGYIGEEDSRTAATVFTGGTTENVALTDSTTMGIATMYGGLSLAAGDEVLTTTHDFFATENALDLLVRRTGARLVRVSLYDEPAEASVERIVGRLMAGVTDRTRVVAITWVHSGTGVRLPVRRIGQAVAEANRGRDRRDRMLLCVDGVHGFASVDEDVADLGCDFLATGTHKWLFGPRGTGILWGRDFSPLTEIIPSFIGDQGGARLTAGGYHAFEHRWALREAFDFMSTIGRDRVVARTVEQATQLKAGLADLPRVRLVTPTSPELSAGIVCIETSGKVRDGSLAEQVESLRTQGIVAGTTPYDVTYLRLGPSIVTTPEQVDAALEALDGLK